MLITIEIAWVNCSFPSEMTKITMRELTHASVKFAWVSHASVNFKNINVS